LKLTYLEFLLKWRLEGHLLDNLAYSTFVVHSIASERMVEDDFCEILEVDEPFWVYISVYV
jgi:hypothetical protein